MHIKGSSFSFSTFEKVDVIRVINEPRNFQNSCVIETSLPDFHIMTATALRMRFARNYAETVPFHKTSTPGN